MGTGSCEECKENGWKYKCPGCGIRTCGLDCVKKHKQRTLCTGKRNRTEFVAVAGMDDKTLVSDYNFLEDALRACESAKRTEKALPVPQSAKRRMRFRNGLSYREKRLIFQARDRSFTLLFLPAGMSKNASNKTFFKDKENRIYWTVEWRFYKTDFTILDFAVDEYSSLKSVLEKHLSIGCGNPTRRHKLGDFVKEPIDNLKLFFRKERTTASKKLYYEFSINKSLHELLVHKTIIEYPVIHVVLPGHSTDFEVTETPDAYWMNASTQGNIDQIEDQKSNGNEAAEGLPFRKEEFEEDEERNRNISENLQEGTFKAKIEGKEQRLCVTNYAEGVPFKEEEFEEGEFVANQLLDYFKEIEEGEMAEGDQ
eukprot:TRINITY_DN16485_c0_g1_i1.p1 TRINITY_DN16485_c0_g1~~TRINITY_DN16485_c0_g1_i1.p1  ORF type:complete len:368 (+),score=42.87 TRINITY_DN16485_c0_g1_i1:111-1214(+)